MHVGLIWRCSKQNMLMPALWCVVVTSSAFVFGASTNMESLRLYSITYHTYYVVIMYHTVLHSYSGSPDLMQQQLDSKASS